MPSKQDPYEIPLNKTLIRANHLGQLFPLMHFSLSCIQDAEGAKGMLKSVKQTSSLFSVKIANLDQPT